MRSPCRLCRSSAMSDEPDAEVTPADRALAPRFWAHYATPLLKALLGAKAGK